MDVNSGYSFDQPPSWGNTCTDMIHLPNVSNASTAFLQRVGDFDDERHPITDTSHDLNHGDDDDEPFRDPEMESTTGRKRDDQGISSTTEARVTDPASLDKSCTDMVLYEGSDVITERQESAREPTSRWTFLQGLTYGIVGSVLLGDALPQAARSISQSVLAAMVESTVRLIGYSDYEFQFSGKGDDVKNALQSVLMQNVLADERAKLGAKERRLASTGNSFLRRLFSKSPVRKRGDESSGSGSSRSGGSGGSGESTSDTGCGYYAGSSWRAV